MVVGRTAENLKLVSQHLTTFGAKFPRARENPGNPGQCKIIFARKNNYFHTAITVEKNERGAY